jgi:hypothetical protein
MRIIATFIILLNVLVSQGSEEYFFRVQCFEENSFVADTDLEKVPELEHYIKRTGEKIYFSGSVFVHYSDAKQRLETLKSRGLLKAFIRVFQRSVLLSGENHKKHYPIAVERSLENETYIRRKQQEKLQFAKLDSIRNEMKKNLIANSKKSETAGGTGIILTKSEESTLVDSIKKQEAPLNPAGLYVDEPVYFVVQVGIALSGEPVPAKLDNVNEIVYSIEDGNKNIYYMGQFEDLKLAIRLQDGVRNSISGTKIIGVYKGKIISLALAQELSAIYLATN